MLKPAYTTKFKRDYRLQKKRHKNLAALDDIIIKLAQQEKLQVKYGDHPLYGKYSDHRECHIEPDWLLIYKIAEDSIFFIRTGTHSDLF